MFRSFCAAVCYIAVSVGSDALAADGLRHLRGTVVDQFGAPIAHAPLWMFPVTAGASYRQIQTGADGRFDEEVEPGVWECFAEFDPFGARDVIASTCDSDKEITVVWHRDMLNCQVTGTIINETGAPVAGVTLSLQQRRSSFYFPPSPASQTSTYDGSFAFVSHAGIWMVESGPYWSPFTMQKLILLADGQSTNLFFQLRESSRSIHGTVRDTANSPIASVSILAEATTNGITYLAEGETDTNGVFVLPSFPWVWRVTVCPPSNDFAIPGPVYLTVADTDITNNFNLAHSVQYEATVTVLGQVTDEVGTPVTNGYLNISSYSWPSFYTNAALDFAGRFECKVVPSDYDILANFSDNAMSIRLRLPLRNEMGTNEVVIIRPNASSTLDVMVNDLDGDAGAGSGVVAELRQGNTNYAVGGRADCSGNASIGLWSGMWMVAVSPANLDSDYTFQRATKPVTIGTSNTAAAFTVRKDRRTVRVRAEFLDESGFAFPEHTLLLGSLHEPFRFAGPDFAVKLLPGSYTIDGFFNQINGWVMPGLRVDVVRQIPETNFSLVVLHPTNLVRGHVQLPSGMSPLAGSVYASMRRSSGSYDISVSPAADRSYEIELPDGTWSLGAYYGDCLCTVTNVTVPGPTATIDFICVSNTPGDLHLVRGRVVDEQEMPLAFMSVLAFDANNVGTSVLTGVDGRFEVVVHGEHADIGLEHGAPGFISGYTRVEAIAGNFPTNVTLVARRPTTTITATVLDEFGTDVPASMGASARIGNMSYSVSAIGDATRLLPVFPAEWQVYVFDSDLNAQGLRSVPIQRSTGLSNEHLIFFTRSIIGNGRVPTLSRPIIESTNIEFEVRSQTMQSYSVQRSTDLQFWESIGTNFTTGGSFSFSDTNAPNSFRFYRAVLLPPLYY
jgi:hypothetical protein